MPYVYGLIDPLDPDVIRYVGVTSKTLNERLCGHVYGRPGRKPTRAAVWVRNLVEEGRRPLILELEGDVDELDLPARERYWIAKFRSPLLLNVRDGGIGLSPGRRAEIAAKISAANRSQVPWMKGRKHSPETRAKISAALKGRSGKPHTPETRAKISAASKGREPPNKGKKASDELRQKYREAAKHRTYTPEGISKIKAAAQKRVGQVRSPETKARISAALSARPPHSSERRKKISAGLTGRKQTSEHVENAHAPLRGQNLSAEARANQQASWTAERRQKASARARALWDDPEYRARRSQAMREGRRKAAAARSNPKPPTP